MDIPMRLTQTITKPDDNFRIQLEQLHAYFQQLPAISIAPALGGVFVCLVLWHVVTQAYLLIGISAVLLISLVRLILYQLYRAQRLRIDRQGPWIHFSIGIAFVSGCVWGSAAIFLYPPHSQAYLVFMLVFLALVPVAPIAAMAVHMPHFYAYYLPCVLPFVLTMALRDSRAEHLTAVLLVMMMGATIAFATKYNKILTDAIRLRLLFSDQKDILQETSKLKTRFMASASHDLRQPLHAIGLFIESLRQQKTDNQTAYLVQKIEESTLSLRQMLNTLLDISRLDAGTIEVNCRDFPLHEILDKLHAEYAPLAAHNGLQLRYVPTRMLVYSDPVLLERLLRNLISNAFKYTRRGGVVIGCRRKRDQLRIQVVDSGIGISAEDITRIFNEYTQLQHSNYAPDKGLGLGLSIVERLATLLGHKVEVQSVPGHGSIFSVTVACSRDQAALPMPAAETNQPLQPFLSNIKVLLLEDDRAVLDAMHSVLESWGAQVVAGRDVQEVMRQIATANTKVDLLIIDYHLANEEKATQLIAKLETVLAYPFKVLIITGDTSPERIHEAHAHGHMLLHKPVEIEKLQTCLRYLVGATSV
jgi:signal transduction histidine kinase/CheY-like chemotaxis protein